MGGWGKSCDITDICCDLKPVMACRQLFSCFWDVRAAWQQLRFVSLGGPRMSSVCMKQTRRGSEGCIALNESRMGVYFNDPKRNAAAPQRFPAAHPSCLPETEVLQDVGADPDGHLCCTSLLFPPAHSSCYHWAGQTTVSNNCSHSISLQHLCPHEQSSCSQPPQHQVKAP